MKKIMSFVLSIVMCFSVMCIVPMSASADKINDGNVRVYINGNKLTFDHVKPQFIGMSTYVPMRSIFSAMGATVSWSASDQTITAKRGDSTIILHINDNIMNKNGEEIVIAKPLIENGSTLVPVRAISEGFDSDVLWNNYTFSVCIFDYYNKDKFVCSTYDIGSDYGKEYKNIPDFSACCGIYNASDYTLGNDEPDKRDFYLYETNYSYSPTNDIGTKEFIEGTKYYTSLLVKLGFSKSSNKKIDSVNYTVYKKSDFEIYIPSIENYNTDFMAIKIIHHNIPMEEILNS